jgi:hypothetical protein
MVGSSEAMTQRKTQAWRVLGPALRLDPTYMARANDSILAAPGARGFAISKGRGAVATAPDGQRGGCHRPRAGFLGLSVALTGKQSMIHWVRRFDITFVVAPAVRSGENCHRPALAMAAVTKRSSFALALTLSLSGINRGRRPHVSVPGPYPCEPKSKLWWTGRVLQLGGHWPRAMRVVSPGSRRKRRG